MCVANEQKQVPIPSSLYSQTNIPVKSRLRERKSQLSRFSKPQLSGRETPKGPVLIVCLETGLSTLSGRRSPAPAWKPWPSRPTSPAPRRSKFSPRHSAEIRSENAAGFGARASQPSNDRSYRSAYRPNNSFKTASSSEVRFGFSSRSLSQYLSPAFGFWLQYPPRVLGTTYEGRWSVGTSLRRLM